MKVSRRTLVGLAVAALAAGGAYLRLRSGGADGPASEGTRAGSAAGGDAPGALPRGARATLAPGPAPVVRDAGDETALEGVVLDAESGDPVRGARVRWGPLEVETDVGGTYRVRAVGSLPDARGIVARAEGYVDGSTSCDRQVWSPAGRLEPILLARVRERRPGRVRDGLDRPVEGAVILVGPGNGRYVSKADGSFGPVPIGDRGLEWRAFSTREARAEGTWDRDAPSPELEIVMPVAAFVDGHVVDEEGRPVGGAAVFLFRQPDELRVATAPDGSFRWPLPSMGVAMLAATTDTGAAVATAFGGAPVRISVRRDGRLPEPSSASPPPSSDPRYGGDADRIRLASRVVDERGRPVPGAEVEGSAPDRSWRVYERTDAEGRFSLEVYAAPIDLRIAHPLGGDPWVRRLDAAGEALPDPVALSPRAVPTREAHLEDPLPERVLRGRVRDAEGRPVPDVAVAADRAGDHTDARGEFLIAGLPLDGSAVLTVEANGTPPLPFVAPAGTSHLDVVLPARGALVVHLRGRPPPESDLDASPKVRLAIVGEAAPWFTHRDGCPGCLLDLGDRIRMDVPIGRYRLDFRIGRGAWMQRAEVAVAAGRETVLEYGFPREVRARLAVQGPEGDRVKEVRLFLADETSGFTYDTEGPGDPDWLGVRLQWMFGYLDVPAGIYRVRIVADGFVPTFADAVDLRNDATVPLTLARGEACSGRITARDGAPVGPGTLAWRAPFGPPVPLGDVAEDGSFGPLLPLPPGPQVFVLKRKGEPDVDVPVDVRPGAAGQPLHLRLP